MIDDGSYSPLQPAWLDEVCTGTPLTRCRDTWPDETFEEVLNLGVPHGLGCVIGAQ
jgi:hypothetical protein